MSTPQQPGQNPPAVTVTTATPNHSQMSIDAAPGDLTKWELTPYKFNSPALPQDSAMDLTEMATIRLPEYHQLVDHTLGVVWKCFSNGKRDVKKMLPDQILWALKMAKAHQGEQSHFSEGVQLLIQYFEEILMSMCAGGMKQQPSKEKSSRKSIELIDSSFILTSMEHQPNLPTPAAASTPLPSRNGPSPSCPQPCPMRGDFRAELIRQLGLLHQMLIRLRKDELRRTDGDLQFLESMERMLMLMGVTEEQRRNCLK